MATRSGYPKWLLDSKDHISQTKEWNGFMSELHDAIQQQLTESHVQYFSDLSEAEKTLFMERAARAIQGGQSYNTLYSQVSWSLDQHLNNEVARELLEDQPVDTKSELVLENAQEGAVSILKKWPDMKSKLHVCLNRPLPDPLRQIAWRLFLENTKMRQQYVNLLNSNPRAAISTQDFAISQKCEQLLITEPTFQQLKGSVGAFYAMKAVLSYHHALKRSRESLIDIDYMLAVPFVSVATPNLSRRDPAAGTVVALLVEEYLSFMETRPGYMIDSGSEEHDEEMKGFVSKVMEHVQKLDPKVIDVFAAAFAPANQTSSGAESSNQALMLEGTTEIVRPLIRALFVGYVNMKVALFIWDQYMIGLDVPGYHDIFLPSIMAVHLLLLADKIKGCEPDPIAVSSLIKAESVKLQVPQYQYLLNRHFYRDLSAALNKDDKAAMPVLDPTQAKYPPWVHWHSEMIPNRTRPQDRRRAREEREAERQRLRELQEEEERQRREAAEREAREEENRLLALANQDKKKSDEDKAYMEELLEKEKKKRLESERQAADEIARLNREINLLKQSRKKSPAPSIMSYDSRISRFLIPPPPSPASTIRTPIPPLQLDKIQTPAPERPPNAQVTDTIVDFLKRVAHSFNKIAHSEGDEKTHLDQFTKDHIKIHRQDVKEAEVEVFGRSLRPGEFDQLTQEEKLDSSDRLMDVLKKKIQERRQRELEQAGK